MQNHKDNDVCEECEVMDGLQVYEGRLVCYRCGKKLKKEGRKRNERSNQQRKIGAIPSKY